MMQSFYTHDMKIIADENIARVAEYFGTEGRLTVMPGRHINAQAVMDADVLLVRSVTVVDELLLKHSRCKFVGTATSGIDHIDVEWLSKNNIGLGWARGSNAESVVNYVFSALAALSRQKSFDWRSLSYGIVGCGEVGRRLASRLQAMHCHIQIYDPFLHANQPLAAHFSTYEQVLQQDVVTFHVPITTSEPWPTFHMLGEPELVAFSPQKILINAARGAVFDTAALLARLIEHPQQPVVLDAWEGEPAIDPGLMERVAIATPHIAGYSKEGKLNGTHMIHAEFRRFFGLERQAEPEPVAEKMVIEIPKNLEPLAQLNHLITNAYDVMQDHDRMQTLLHSSDLAAQFDQLRKNYPVRHEFSAFSVKRKNLAADVQHQASVLGFTLLD